MQGTSDRIGEYLHLRERPGADAVFLTYDREREGCIFFPNSTWMQGRNRMLAEARKLGDYRYFIFMDDDVEFVRGSYDEFESLLLQLRPAIGVPVVDRLRDAVVGFGSALGRTYLPYMDWQIAWDYDGQMNAYHRDLVLDGLVLPYWESFTDNWWVSDVISSALAMNFYPEEMLQFNRIVISNNLHRDYPRALQMKQTKEKAAHWMASQFAGKCAMPIPPQFSLRRYLRRLIFPFKSKYFRRNNPRGLVAPPLHWRAIIAQTRAYRPSENYRVNPQTVAEKLHPDSPLYQHYLRHRAD